MTTDVLIVEGLCGIRYIKRPKKKKIPNDLQIPTLKTASSTGSKVTADVMALEKACFPFSSGL